MKFTSTLVFEILVQHQNVRRTRFTADEVKELLDGHQHEPGARTNNQEATARRQAAFLAKVEEKARELCPEYREQQQQNRRRDRRRAARHRDRDLLTIQDREYGQALQL